MYNVLLLYIIIIYLFIFGWVGSSLCRLFCTMPGFPVLHCLPEFAQIHVHSVMLCNHLILCHPLLLSTFPSIRGLFKWVSSSHQVAKGLYLQLQRQAFQWVFRVDFFRDCLLWSPCSSKDFQESSLVPQFESINSLALSLFYGSLLTSIHDYRKKHSFDYTDLCQQSDISAF